MTRLSLANALLLVGLLAIWGVCFALHVNELIRSRLAWVPVHVNGAAGPEDYPTLRGFWGDAAKASGLRAGDRLLSVADTDLRGVGRLGFFARVYREAGSAARLPVRFARGDVRSEGVLVPTPVSHPWLRALLSLAFALVPALAFWRVRGAPVGRIFFLAGVAYALHWSLFWGGSPSQTWAAMGVFSAGSVLSLPLTIRVIQEFPEEVARRHRASALWPWVFALGGAGVTTWVFGVPLPPEAGQPLDLAVSIAFIATSIGLLTRSYRAAGPAGRRQIRWVVFGFWAGLVPPLVVGSFTLAVPAIWWLYEVSLATVIAIPICLLIALTRFNLFDVDRLITTAASFTILSVVLLGSLLLAIPFLARSLSDALEPAVTQTALSLALAALLLPANRLLDRRVRQVLFPERDALERSAQSLRRALAGCEKPTELLALLGARLRELVRPECLVIYGRAGQAFAPVFAEGRALVPAFDPNGPLVVHLEREHRAVDAARAGRSVRDAPASPAERAALESMGVELILPLVLDDELAAFVCLGEKRSGDVFTRTDRALLQSVSDKASDELLRFGQAEIYRQERAMAERMRRYVPGAVAERISSGGELDSSEREVSVLFVDIRGYTSFSEGQRSEAIFSVVNEYTSAVSGIVRRHGGSVVEFNGDGMMVVFGAPQPHPRKEQAAVEAAREIAGAVPRMAARKASGEPVSLEVGIGVATGEAFVGNIKAVDRYIWSAIGNTTNLAARLQSLTRDLAASIAIEARTHAAAGPAAADFKHFPGIRVRGRREPMDLFTLPLVVGARPSNAESETGPEDASSHGERRG